MKCGLNGIEGNTEDSGNNSDTRNNGDNVE